MTIHTLNEAKEHIRRLLDTADASTAKAEAARSVAREWLVAERPDPWKDLPGQLGFEDWYSEVTNENTRLGYLEWAAGRIASQETEGESWCPGCGWFFRTDDRDLMPEERKEGDEPDGRCLECRGLEKCRECEKVYHTCGDGYCGLCPSCADAEEDAEGEIVYRTLEVRVGLRIPEGGDADHLFNELDITIEPQDEGVSLVDQEVTAMRG